MLPDMENTWFQQSGATAYTFRRAMGILREMFPCHMISFCGDIGWPPVHLDFNVYDFFPWEYCTTSQRFRVITLNLLYNLKDAICQEITAFPNILMKYNYQKQMK